MYISLRSLLQIFIQRNLRAIGGQHNYLDNVAQINADADVNLLDRLFVSVVGAELGVHLLGTLHGVYYGRKIDQLFTGCQVNLTTCVVFPDLFSLLLWPLLCYFSEPTLNSSLSCSTNTST